MASQPTDEEIIAAVDSLQEEEIEFLKKLVSIDSTLGSVGERDVQLFMEDAFKKLDSSLLVDKFLIEKHKIETLRGFSPSDWPYDDKKLTVVATHNPRNGNSLGKTLIFNGHVDVVPVGEDDPWTSPPFQPEIRDDKLYGRGAGDMKSGVAAFYFAYKALLKLGFRPASKLWMQTVLEEECTGNGALSCLERGFDKADAVIIPEPFPWLVVAQLGVMWMRIQVKGKPAHVLNTSAGKNAIEEAFLLYESLRKVEERWNQGRLRESDAPAPHPAYQNIQHPINFNLGIINGGNWASSVPSECTIEVRVGVFPGIDLKDARKVIEETLEEAAKRSGINYSLEWRGFQAEGCVMDGEHPSIQLLGKLHEEVTSTPKAILPITATTDARFYQNSGVPATCYGCLSGSIHGVDEWVCLRSLQNVTRIMALFIAKWCLLEKIQQD